MLHYKVQIIKLVYMITTVRVSSSRLLKLCVGKRWRGMLQVKKAFRHNGRIDDIKCMQFQLQAKVRYFFGRNRTFIWTLVHRYNVHNVK